MIRAFCNNCRGIFKDLLTAVIIICTLCPFPSYSGTLSYSYDESGRLIQESYEDGSTITFTYDEVGNRLSKEVLAGAGVGITVTSPGGGENWQVGTSKTIQWSYRGNPGSDVRIELLKGGVLNSVITPGTSIGSGVTGSYAWVIPAGQSPGSDYQVKVMSTDNTAYSGTSNANFSINSASGITLTSPNGGEEWQGGSTRNIQWTYSGIAESSVKIELLKNGELDSTITESSPIGSGGNGSYSWIVPITQASGTDYKIRISSTANSACAVTSNSDFTIVQGSENLMLLCPNGGGYQAGTTFTITWRYVGNPGSSVMIELMKGGILAGTVVESTSMGSAGSGSYHWAIPVDQQSGYNYKIRISSTSNSAYTDSSNADFSIVATGIAVTGPNSAVSWQAATTRTITWSYTGNPGESVKIELLKAGVLNNTIVESTPVGNGASGSYMWSIPPTQAAGSDYNIRITSTSNSAYTDSSNTNFSIVGTGITLISPNSPVSWQAATIHPITWSYTGSPGGSVKIELLKAGVLNSTIVESTPVGSAGSGSYMWSIPPTQAAGSDYNIRITSMSNSAYTDSSNTNFSIVATGVTVTSPNTAVSWQTGTTQAITWSYTGSPGASVKIELLKAGALDITIVESTPVGNAGSGSYMWSIPTNQAGGSDYSIRITSTSNNVYTDTSNTGFTILVPNQIIIISPNGGESLLAGNSQTISWSYTGNPGASVGIELLKAGALNTTIATNISIGADGNGSYSWTIPAAQQVGADYKIKVKTAQYSDISNTDFSITNSSVITVASPRSGEYFQAGMPIDLQWTYAGTSDTAMKIELLKGGVVNSVITPSIPIGTGGSGSLIWTIPSGQATGNDYQIKITCGSLSDISNGNFSILPRLVTVTSPNTAVSWQGGATQAITWSYAGNPGASVKIELLKAGALDSTIVESTPVGSAGSGSYMWSIPASQAGGSDYCIRITSTSNDAYTDSSNTNFSVVATGIAITSPNTAVSWQVTTTQAITWSYTGNPGASVKIELLKAGALDSTIVESTPVGSAGSGSYMWSIPATQAGGSDYSIRVTSTSNSAYTDSSNTNFSIVATGIAITSPNTAVSWQAATTQAITWAYTGSPGASVKIELLKAGALDSTIVESTPVGSAGSGSYMWSIPAAQAEGSDYSIRVTSTSNSAYTDTGNTNFSIVATRIAITSPNTAVSWQAATTQAITWAYTGSPGASVKIELLKAGALDSTIVESTPVGGAGSGSYMWSIPATQAGGPDYSIRVTSTSNGAYTDSSNTNFSIVSTGIVITGPNTAVSWQAATTQAITWSYTGSPGASVKIELLKAGALDSTIVESTPVGSAGSGSYMWSIPAAQAEGSDYGIRVTSTSNSAYTDTGNTNFSIVATGIAVLSPNTAVSWQGGTTQAIIWSYTGSPGTSVKIELLKAGILDGTIVESTPIGTAGSGSYYWAIPASQPLGSDYKIRLTGMSNSSYVDTSESNFSIAPASVNVAAPKGSEKWGAGTIQVIWWTYKGDPGSSVKIELLKGGTVNNIIATDAAGSAGYGLYYWQIPADSIPGADYQVRITSNSDTAFLDTSDNFFTISPISIALTYPNGGEVLKTGVLVTIRWTYTGDPGPSVMIELLKGEILQGVIVSRAPSGSAGNGSFAWKIPASQALGSDYRIRITSATDSSCTDSSNGNFTIQAQ